MAEVPQFTNKEAEIKFLEEKLRERTAALEGASETIVEKEVLREVIREHIQNIHSAPSPRPITTPDPLQNIQEHKEKIAKLVDIAFSRGITEAIRVAQGLRDPHLLDEFHDTLVDHFYKQMVASGIIKKQHR